MISYLLPICIVICSLAQSHAPQMPAPGAEQKNLAFFVGTWKVEGTMHASAFGPAGTMTGTETCRMFEGGWHLVCDSQASGPLGAMKSHTLMTYDVETKQYRYVSISNMPAMEAAAGTRTDGRWEWSTDATVAGATVRSRFIMTELSPSSYMMKWESSADGKTWQPIFEGKGTKGTQ